MRTDTTMTAAVYRRFGAPEVVRLEQRAIPTPRPGEVLIRVHASTVSVADHRARARDVPAGLGLLAAVGLGVFRPSRPILGMDAAGVVAAVGSGVTAFIPGDRVIAAMGGAFGGHAEYVCVPADGAITRAPSIMSLDEAVTLVFGGIAAMGFFAQAPIGPGASVLVNGASGAVGTAAVQLASQLGADVTAVTSGGNAALVSSLGAARVIDYTREDFTAGGETYDVIVDCVGNIGVFASRRLLRAGGRHAAIAANPQVMLRALASRLLPGKPYRSMYVVPSGGAVAQFAGWFERGQMRVVLDRTYPLAQIAEAQAYVERGRSAGKVAISIGA